MLLLIVNGSAFFNRAMVQAGSSFGPAVRFTMVMLTLNVALLVNYAGSGLYDRKVAEVSGVLALTIVPGLWIGERVHRKLDAARFERVVWVVLLLAGSALAVRSAWSLA